MTLAEPLNAETHFAYLPLFFYIITNSYLLNELSFIVKNPIHVECTFANCTAPFSTLFFIFILCFVEIRFVMKRIVSVFFWDIFSNYFSRL